MPYKATGRPPGRPKKIPASKPLPSEPVAAEVVSPEILEFCPDEESAVPRSVPVVVAPGLGGLCNECYPDGWPDGATGLGCRHGSWTRLTTGIVG